MHASPHSEGAGSHQYIVQKWAGQTASTTAGLTGSHGKTGATGTLRRQLRAEAARLYNTSLTHTEASLSCCLACATCHRDAKMDRNILRRCAYEPSCVASQQHRCTHAQQSYRMSGKSRWHGQQDGQIKDTLACTIMAAGVQIACSCCKDTYSVKEVVAAVAANPLPLPAGLNSLT